MRSRTRTVVLRQVEAVCLDVDSEEAIVVTMFDGVWRTVGSRSVKRMGRTEEGVSGQ